MRLQGLKLGLGVGLLLATGCGQLWRPFLEASSCDPSANCATEDLSVPTEPPMVVWSKQGPPNGLAADLYAVAAGADNEVMVGGDNGTFWRYKAGVAWSSPLAVNSKRVRSLYTHGQGQSWAAGDAATVQVWNGTGWARNPPPGTLYPSLSSIWVDPQKSIWTVGSSNTIYVFNGITGGWGSMPSPGPAAELLTAVTGAGPYLRWLASDHATVYQWDGAAFSTLPATPTVVRSMWAASETELWVAGDAGMILRRTTAGWEPQALPGLVSARRINSIVGNGQGKLWAVGEGGLVLHFDGSRWRLEDAATTVELTAVSVPLGREDAWLVGLQSTIRYRAPSLPVVLLDLGVPSDLPTVDLSKSDFPVL